MVAVSKLTDSNIPESIASLKIVLDGTESPSIEIAPTDIAKQ